jgi:hypothetical protein
MLLSYYQDKNNILDSKNGLESKLFLFASPDQWGAPVTSSLNPPSQPPGTTLPSNKPISGLRWNQWPRRGTADATLAKLYDSAIAITKLKQTNNSVQSLRLDAASGQASLQQLGTQIDLRIATLSSIAANLNIDTNVVNAIPNQAVTVSSVWKRTVSPTESQRIFQDWSLLSQYVASERQRQAVFKEICNQAAAQGQRDGRLVALTMDNPDASNNVYTIDKMTFEQMSTHLDSAAHDLLTVIGSQAKSESLREKQATTFRDLDQEYQIAQFHYDASLLGIEVAKKAIEIANLGKASASIDMQINQLNLQIASINKMTAADRSKVAGLQEELASEALELAEIMNPWHQITSIYR